ncbi:MULTISPECIES: multicopper oxidase domain-containing protein [unclassified Streptomyces]|uniref:multicopper oxidase domain-containing protein n=1 Tax=unclassified Streptomyces TaxID=2593676 RepID=UPI0022770E9C|nr:MULTISPECIES: multicopper oxidase domain-containing protein [unclassified Streptomyces]
MPRFRRASRRRPPNGRLFCPASPDVPLRPPPRRSGSNTSPMDHPFHLHVWPFHVLAGSAGMPSAGVLQDVVLVPARGWVRLPIPFSDFAGRSVFHCHILDHEDLGMMATVNVRGQ